MAYTKQRRVQRIRLANPIIGRLGTMSVVLIDVSLDGAKIEHGEQLQTGAENQLVFPWKDETLRLRTRVTRCRLERFTGGADGLTVYHSGLLFLDVGESAPRLRDLVATHITRALEEQKANARGQLPQSIEHMPIFRGYTLTLNREDAAAEIGHASLPSSRIARQVGYICCRLTKNSWKRTKTSDPEQPEDGFTVSAAEDLAQLDQLCESYRLADDHGRELIRMLARMSIAEGEGSPERFKP